MALRNALRAAAVEAASDPRNAVLLGGVNSKTNSPAPAAPQAQVRDLAAAVNSLPHVRKDGSKHPNAFDARLNEAVLCTSETPLLSAARVLLTAGIAEPNDTIVMRHAGSGAIALRAKVGVAAGLSIGDPASGGGPRLRKIEQDAQHCRRMPPRIAQTPSPAPGEPHAQNALCGGGVPR